MASLLESLVPGEGQRVGFTADLAHQVGGRTQS